MFNYVKYDRGGNDTENDGIHDDSGDLSGKVKDVESRRTLVQRMCCQPAAVDMSSRVVVEQTQWYLM